MTTWPPVPRSIIGGMNRSQPCTTPIRLTAIWRSQSSGVVSKNPAPTPMPALLISRSTVSNRACTASANSSIASVSVTSTVCASTSAPKLPGGFGGLLQTGLVQIADGQPRAAARRTARVVAGPCRCRRR